MALYDLIIVGAGPAGMTAAVYAARKKIPTLLLSEDVGGQVNWTLAVENYMGYQLVEGPDLMQKFEEQVRQFPIDMRTSASVRSFSRVGDGFRVETAEGAFDSRAAIICTGKHPKMLNVPGEERLRGRGVTYCAVCDGPLFGGMRVAVIGGGNSALEAAYDMMKVAEQVDVISLTPLTGDQVLIDKIRDASNVTVGTRLQTLEIIGDDRVTGIRVRDLATERETRIDVQGVLVEIGLVPNSDLVRGIVGLNAEGEIEINCSCETGVPGLFAAGDVTNVPAKQIVVAAGDGAKASMMAHQYLQRL